MENSPPVLVGQPIDPNIQAIQNNMSVIAELPAILQTHQLRVSKALNTARQILSAITGINPETDEQSFLEAIAKLQGKISPELFEASKQYIIACRDLKGQLEASRKPGTQSFDLIRTMFTNEEKKIAIEERGTLVYWLQQYNNKFITDQEKEKQRIADEANRKAQKDIELVSIKADFCKQIDNCLTNFTYRQVNLIQDNFNKITLEIFDEKSEGLKKMVTDFPKAKQLEIVKAVNAPAVIYHTIDEINLILTEIWKGYAWETAYNKFSITIGDLKTKLIADLPAKKEELEKIATASKQELDRLLQEQLDREERTRKEQQEAEETAKLKTQQEAEATVQTGQIEALFASQAAIPTGPEHDTKKSIEIKVNTHAGIVEIFTLWFQIYGVKLTIDEILGKKPSSWISDLQKEAAKPGGRKIESDNVTYKTVTKSVNRKEKKEDL